jgi:hypothetical protein
MSIGAGRFPGRAEVGFPDSAGFSRWNRFGNFTRSVVPEFIRKPIRVE